MELNKSWFQGYFIGVGAMLIISLIFFSFSNPTEALIRENERCLYENATLEDANTRLLEELSETVEDWREE